MIVTTLKALYTGYISLSKDAMQDAKPRGDADDEKRMEAPIQ